MIDLKHLKTLSALAETGSLVAAAQRLFLTQSALSHQLKELESRLEKPLFVRKSRPLQFTREGELLLELAKEVLPKMQRTMDLLQQSPRQLRIAVECHSCFHWLLPLIEDYQAAYPGIELELNGSVLDTPLAPLLDGEVELLITSDPVVHSQLQAFPLNRFEMKLVMPLEHPLADKEWIEPEDLREQTLICYPVEPNRLEVVNRFLTPAGIRPQSFRSTRLSMMQLQQVNAGLGVAVLPQWLVDGSPSTGQLVTKSLGDQGLWSTLYGVVNRQYGRRELDDLIALAREYWGYQPTAC